MYFEYESAQARFSVYPNTDTNDFLLVMVHNHEVTLVDRFKSPLDAIHQVLSLNTGLPVWDATDEDELPESIYDVGAWLPLARQQA